MRPFHLLLTVVAALIALLTLANILLGRANGAVGTRIAEVQHVLQSGPSNLSGLRAVIARIEESQDAQLKALLVKLEINVTPNPAPAAR